MAVRKGLIATAYSFLLAQILVSSASFCCAQAPAQADNPSQQNQGQTAGESAKAGSLDDQNSDSQKLKGEADKTGTSSTSLKGQTEKAAPLQGQVDQEGKNPSLSGESGKSDKATPLKGNANQDSLKGGVNTAGSGLKMPTQLKLNAQQYKMAVQTYESDLSKFYIHVKDYQNSMLDLKKLRGECTENEDQYKALVKQQQLNTTALYIPTVTVNVPPPPPPPRPPRACCINCLITGRCGHLGTGGGAQGGGPAGPNTSRVDAQRIAAASQALAQTQAQLQSAQQISGEADKQVMDFAKVEQKQQDVSDQFGQLRKEYDILKIERDMLKASVPGKK